MNGKASSSHNHDDRYFTETEIKNIVWNEIQVKEYQVDNISLTADVPITQKFNIAQNGWYIAGIMSHSAENATSGGILCSIVNIYDVWFSQTEAWINLRAIGRNAKVKVKIKVLYWKDCR